MAAPVRALSAFWGSSFALIKIALEAGVAPPWVAFARCAFGAVTLVAICVLTRTPLPRDRSTWGHAAVVAVRATFAYMQRFFAGALGTGWAYVLNLGVVRAAGPTVAGGVLVVAGVVVTRLPERA
ncbi:MAG: hypothetical protein ACXWYP_04655 [Pseudonocardia sp.]